MSYGGSWEAYVQVHAGVWQLALKYCFKFFLSTDTLKGSYTDMNVYSTTAFNISCLNEQTQGVHFLYFQAYMYMHMDVYSISMFTL